MSGSHVVPLSFFFGSRFLYKVTKPKVGALPSKIQGFSRSSLFFGLGFPGFRVFGFCGPRVIRLLSKCERRYLRWDNSICFRELFS